MAPSSTASATASFLVRLQTLEDRDDRDGRVAHAVRRAQAGDLEAMAFLYRRYAGNICGYVYSIVGDEHEAEDLTQHLFAKLITTVSRYEERSLPFSRWILRVAHNVAIDHLRSRRAIPSEDLFVAGAPADETGRDRLASLTDALDSLPPDQRDVAVLRHVLGLSPDEIARRLGRTRGSVTGLQHRGRRALCRALVERGSAPTVRAASVAGDRRRSAPRSAGPETLAA